MFKNLGRHIAENTEGIRAKAAVASAIVLAIVIAAAMINKYNSENELPALAETPTDIVD